MDPTELYFVILLYVIYIFYSSNPTYDQASEC